MDLYDCPTFAARRQLEWQCYVQCIEACVEKAGHLEGRSYVKQRMAARICSGMESFWVFTKLTRGLYRLDELQCQICCPVILVS
jgi:hypothetical protein